MIIRGDKAENNGLLQVAELMCIAARTAPKARGTDTLETFIATAEDLQLLAAEMRRWGEQTGASFCIRDAGNIEQLGAVVVLGTTVKALGVPGCGYCGFGNCDGMQKAGGICAYNAGDLGIAVASAASIAAAHHVDNRVMFSVGRAAINLKMFQTDVRIAYGIPLSVSGKSPFFDRPAT